MPTAEDVSQGSAGLGLMDATDRAPSNNADNAERVPRGRDGLARIAMIGEGFHF